MASTTQYSGRPDNEAVGAQLNIASSTNATPIVVTTSTAHGLLDGARVLIRNHVTNVNANGLWSIAVISSTQIALYRKYGGTASSGTAVGAASGTVQPLGLAPTFLIPDDTSVGAADINVGLEDHGDRSQWLTERTGFRYLAQEFDLQSSNFATGATAPTAWLTDVVNQSAWNYGAGTQLAQIVDVFDGDMVELFFSSTVDTKTVSTVGGAAFALHYALSDYGVAPNYSVATRATSGLFVGQDTQVPITLLARIGPIVTGNRGKQLSLVLKYLGFNVSNRTFSLVGDSLWTARVLRAR